MIELGLKIAFDIRTHKVMPLQQGVTLSSDVTVKDFVEVNANEFWIATKRGIYIPNSLGRFKNKISENSMSHNPLAANDKLELFRDIEGAIWCATYYGGISYFSPIYPASLGMSLFSRISRLQNTEK